MTDLDRLLSDFIDTWNAGQNPSVRDYLALTDDDRDRSELASQLAAFLDVAPIPAYPPGSLDHAFTGSVVDAAAAAFETSNSAWPTLLPRWRAAAGLSFQQLAGRVLESAGLPDADHERAATYLASMERGALDAGSVTERAMNVVARALGVNARDLVAAGRPIRPVAAAPLFRAVDVDGADNVGEKLTALTEAMLAPVEPGPVDEFFLGGT